MKNTWRADPLVWGHRPRVFEVFLEPTYPFSVKAFGKLDDLLGEAGAHRITIKLRLQSQPWHMYSGVIVRCILAASTLERAMALQPRTKTSVLRRGTESSHTRCWRKPDSNLRSLPEIGGRSEPSQPGAKTRVARQNALFSTAGPMFRTRLPPAASPVRT